MGRSLPSVVRATSRLLCVGAALSCLHLGCDDSSPGGGTAGSGGSGGADDNALGAATSIGVNGGTGGTQATGGSGGSGGSSGGISSVGGSTNVGGSLGGSAGAGVALEGDPRCIGEPLGSVCLGHFLTTCEDVDDDGLVDFEQLNCAPGVCGGDEPSCQAGNDGESCSAPILVAASGFVLRGDDFASDFEGDIELTDDSCFFADPDSSDAVFEVSLEAGQTLSVTQTGKLSAVLALQSACGGSEACIDSDDSSRGLSLEYTASSAETVFVVLDAYQADPVASDYALHIDIDATCGNGVFEGTEDCDDGNTDDDDGCSATCAVEFPYECTKTSPSLCEVPTSLGSFGPDEEFGYSHETRFDEGERHAFTFTLTERVLLDITATSNSGGTGDINFRLYTDWNTRLTGIQAGNERHEGYLYEAGTYFIELWPAADLPSGYTLTFETHGIVCGDGEVAEGVEECDNELGDGCEDCTVTFGWKCDAASPSNCTELVSVGQYAAGAPIADVTVNAAVAAGSEYQLIEFTTAVEMSGTAVSIADPSRYGFETITLWSESQAEYSEYVYPTSGAFGPWSIEPGKYVLELTTYTGLPEGYVLDLETAP